MPAESPFKRPRPAVDPNETPFKRHQREVERQVTNDALSYAAYLETAKLDARFQDTSDQELTEMWRSGRNEAGRQLSGFECHAIAEAWVARWGCFPPELEDSDLDAPAHPEPDDVNTVQLEDIPRDTMLPPKEVARLTSLSIATLKRYVRSGKFPPARSLGKRRIGWLAREVNAWLDSCGHDPRKLKAKRKPGS